MVKSTEYYLDLRAVAIVLTFGRLGILLLRVCKEQNMNVPTLAFHRDITEASPWFLQRQNLKNADIVACP